MSEQIEKLYEECYNEFEEVSRQKLHVKVNIDVTDYDLDIIVILADNLKRLGLVDYANTFDIQNPLRYEQENPDKVQLEVMFTHLAYKFVKMCKYS